MPSPTWCAANGNRIRAALAWIEPRLEPIGPDRVEKALAVLASTTKHSAGEAPVTWEVRAKEYRRLLGHYSAEVWMHAIDTHRRRCAFWPTIAELEALMKPKDAELRISANRLRKMLGAEPEADPGGKQWADMTDDERAALDALVRETKARLAMAAA